MDIGIFGRQMDLFQNIMYYVYNTEYLAQLYKIFL